MTLLMVFPTLANKEKYRMDKSWTKNAESPDVENKCGASTFDMSPFDVFPFQPKFEEFFYINMKHL